MGSQISGAIGLRTAPGLYTQNLEIKSKKPTAGADKEFASSLRRGPAALSRADFFPGTGNSNGNQRNQKPSPINGRWLGAVIGGTIYFPPSCPPGVVKSLAPFNSGPAGQAHKFVREIPRNYFFVGHVRSLPKIAAKFTGGGVAGG
jgi:hypothetical protein